MNERLNELAIKAGAYMTGVLGLNAGRPAVEFQSKESFEKFVELLIKECLDICEDVAERNDPAIACYYDIKQRFGIKS